MSNKQQLIASLEAMGFVHKPGANIYTLADREYVTRELRPIIDNRAEELTIGQGKGYSGFACTFYFDEGGKFVDHACYE